MPEDIFIFDHKLEVGDEVRALHFMPDKQGWSQDKRNYRVTSLDPLMGREQWTGGGGSPRGEWRLSRRGIELVRPKRSSLRYGRGP
jgi:hypothetical protein